MVEQLAYSRAVEFCVFILKYCHFLAIAVRLFGEYQLNLSKLGKIWEILGVHVKTPNGQKPTGLNFVGILIGHFPNLGVLYCTPPKYFFLIFLLSF